MAAGLTLEQMEFLANRGMSIADAIEFAKLGSAKSKGAERTARWRARKQGNVTGDVTGDASPPPIENHTPPVSSNEETTAPLARKLKKVPQPLPAKPDGVTDQTWADWCAMRDRQKAPISQTAINGIKSEAGKAGWTMEAALARAVMRNWRGFEADWVKNDARPSGDPSDFLANLVAKQTR